MPFWGWSKTAANNGGSDSTINWAEGMPPAQVNDSGRAMMARTAEYRDDTGGTLTTAGSSTAYTVSTNQGFSSLANMNNQSFVIVPHTTSGANPTLAVDGLAAAPIHGQTTQNISAGALIQGTPYRVTYNNSVPEFIVHGAAMPDGGIDTAMLAAGAVTGAKIASNTITSSNMGAGSVTAAAVANSFIPLGTPMLNGTIVQSQATNAQTFAIKTLAGADPSSSDPVTFLFRDVTAGTGDYVVVSLQAALSITIPSTKTMGFVNATPGRVWIGALNNAGTVELFVINASTFAAGGGAGALYPLQGWGIISTSAVSGATSSYVAYSTSARSSVPYVTLGYATWEAGGTLAVAGTWNTPPTRLQLFQAGSVPLPGMEVQRLRHTTAAYGGDLGSAGTTVFATADTIPQNTAGDQYLSQAITPTSSANVLEIAGHAVFSINGGGSREGIALFQDSTANALTGAYVDIAGANNSYEMDLQHEMMAGTLSATTFKIRMGNAAGNGTQFNGLSGARTLGGVANSFIKLREIMG
jgi:hypothetical protein